MSELAMTLLRLTYLVLLWAFVWAAISVLRQDLYSSTRVTSRGRGRPGAKAAGQAAAAGASAAVRKALPTAGGSSRAPSRLKVTAGKLAGTSVPLGRSAIVVGRSQGCSLVIDDEYSSSRHARFFPNGDTWFVEDLDSTNGTFVDGQRITEPTALALGQEVRIGGSAMELSR